MALQVSPDLEQRVIELAHATQREPAVVLDELLRSALEADAEFHAEVAEGFAQIERGESISHEELMRQVRNRLEQYGPRPE